MIAINRTYSLLADLPLVIDGYALEGLSRRVSTGFRRGVNASASCSQAAPSQRSHPAHAVRGWHGLRRLTRRHDGLRCCGAPRIG